MGGKTTALEHDEHSTYCVKFDTSGCCIWYIYYGISRQVPAVVTYAVCVELLLLPLQLQYMFISRPLMIWAVCSYIFNCCEPSTAPLPLPPTKVWSVNVPCHVICSSCQLTLSSSCDYNSYTFQTVSLLLLFYDETGIYFTYSRMQMTVSVLLSESSQCSWKIIQYNHYSQSNCVAM